jgi:Domain of unknown function (DUF4288)
MNWYLAKLVFAIHQPTQTEATQFDEQLRLIEAKDKLEAMMKGRMLGIKEEHTFSNDHGQDVRWEFVDLVELREIDHFVDGMEIHSRIDEHEAVESYKDFVKHRGQLLITEVERSTMQVAV